MAWSHPLVKRCELWALSFAEGTYNLKIGPVGFSPEFNVVNFKFNYDEEIPGIDNSRYYLSLPLLLKWYLGPLNLHAGPQFSYLVGGRWESNNVNECILDQCIEAKKDGEIQEIDISIYMEQLKKA